MPSHLADCGPADCMVVVADDPPAETRLAGCTVVVADDPPAETNSAEWSATICVNQWLK